MKTSVIKHIRRKFQNCSLRAPVTRKAQTNSHLKSWKMKSYLYPNPNIQTFPSRLTFWKPLTRIFITRVHLMLDEAFRRFFLYFQQILGKKRGVSLLGKTFNSCAFIFLQSFSEMLRVSWTNRKKASSNFHYAKFWFSVAESFVRDRPPFRILFFSLAFLRNFPRLWCFSINLKLVIFVRLFVVGYYVFFSFPFCFVFKFVQNFNCFITFIFLFATLP